MGPRPGEKIRLYLSELQRSSRAAQKNHLIASEFDHRSSFAAHEACFCVRRQKLSPPALEALTGRRKDSISFGTDRLFESRIFLSNCFEIGMLSTQLGIQRGRDIP
ncbi:hypothetical protein M5K25_012684 [Dendrobium thyrsiflorum]|uniref:Uncharacterized protein n=1 Tax=Dendrobium thyrsiflorum TaxID=117978 RepID=A0ABD0UY63_DENTH